MSSALNCTRMMITFPHCDFAVQFQPVLVKDQEESQNGKSAELVTNGRRGKKNSNQRDAAGSTPSAASPKASK